MRCRAESIFNSLASMGAFLRLYGSGPLVNDNRVRLGKRDYRFYRLVLHTVGDSTWRDRTDFIAIRLIRIA